MNVRQRRDFAGTDRPHGGLNQEKYLKSCLGLGPIFIESITSEVFKTDFRPSETLYQKHIGGLVY